MFGRLLCCTEGDRYVFSDGGPRRSLSVGADSSVLGSFVLDVPLATGVLDSAVSAMIASTALLLFASRSFETVTLEEKKGGEAIPF